jgi:23S rRNA pseudouridine1911/1915/1917 synthase
VTESVHKFKVPAGEQQRLDRFLASVLPQHSRARLQNLIRDGQLKINDRVVTKSGQALDGGESIELLVPAAVATSLVAENIPLDIVFENKDVIVVNKPAGLVVHPAAGHAQGTLIHAVLAHAPEIEGVGGELRPGLVHRLDKDTSGLIVLAKNELAQRSLQDQFQSREVKKTYIALVEGHPPSANGRVDATIGRDPRERKRMAVVSPGKGRNAFSEYKTLEKFPEHTLLEVSPRTGRTHQIRVHMAFIGCPIAGDKVYGHKRKPTLLLNRHFLHAAKLSLRLPGDEQPSSFEAPLPPDLQGVLDTLRASVRQRA